MRGSDFGVYWGQEPAMGFSAIGGTIASPPAAASPAAGQVVVFARGSDGALWANTNANGSTWQGWTSLGGRIR